MSAVGNERWDFVGSSWGNGRQRLWREHSDAVNYALQKALLVWDGAEFNPIRETNPSCIL